MTITIYQVDAFTDHTFGGNPAAVCPLENWIPEATMQAIASENNLSETAFFVKKENCFEIKWFTPTCEIDLCGHATLASAHVIFSYLHKSASEIQFESKSGVLTVTKKGTWYHLNFPSEKLRPIELPDLVEKSIGAKVIESYQGKWKAFFVLENKKTIQELKPNFSALMKLPYKGIIVTAKGEANEDFVSRFFAPKIGINEDPVTGSAHTLLIPYWSQKLTKKELAGVQLSQRKGYLKCQNLGERVLMGGQAITYLTGKITL